MPLTVKMCSADTFLIDAARGTERRAAWIRSAALTAARAGMVFPGERGDGWDASSPVSVLVMATDEEANLINAATGDVPRSIWMRAAALAAAA